jgi:hypothetical protein
MKKKMLPLAISAAAAVSMSASAQMYLNQEGTGEILIFPLYTAESGNVTNVNLVNTTANGKAVKVRIIEGQNSQEVLDFNVYMSPADHFSFAISATEEGGGMIKTNDNTCTVPAIPEAGEPFRTQKFKGDASTVEGSEYTNNGVERTAIGYIEIIEMGQLTEEDFYNDASSATSNAMLAAITHDADGVPADCSLPVAAWSTAADGTAGAWKAQAATVGLARGAEYMSNTWQGGGLYGYAGVVNGADANAFGEDPAAIAEAVLNTSTGYALHYEPGDTEPDFTDPALNTVSLVASGGVYYSTDYAATTLTTVDAISSLFQSSRLMNDYVTDSSINALTDWVVTMPTKSFYVNEDPVIAPFFDAWDGKTACEYVMLESWDREESTPPAIDQSGGPDFSPSPDPDDPTPKTAVPLCFEMNVVQFGETSALKTPEDGLVVGVGPRLDAADGWAYLDFDPASLPAAEKALADGTRILGGGTNGFVGLPVTGFAVQTYTNNSVNGSGNVANYAMSTEHKSVVTLSN